MNSYYFKIDTPVGIRYCEFVAGDRLEAINRALFACFTSAEEEELETSFAKAVPDKIERLLILQKYLPRIEDTTKEIYLEKDEKQTD